jgi:hypothetical protein
MTDLQHPFPRRRAPLHDVDHPAERDERPAEEDEVAAERHELPERDPAADDGAAAGPEHHEGAQPETEREARIEAGLQADQAAVPAHVLIVRLAEPVELGALLAERADNPHPGQRLLDDGAHLGELGLNLVEALVDRPAEVVRGQRHAGQRQERQHGQPEVDPGHHGDGDEEAEYRARGVHERRSDEHPDGAEVVGGARHQIARPVCLVVGQRQPLEMGERIVAEVILDRP